MALSPVMSARARAIVLLTTILDRLDAQGEQVRSEDVAEVVDALLEAARAPESAHTRAVAAERTRPTPYQTQPSGEEST